jgi:hypothetical protein
MSLRISNLKMVKDKAKEHGLEYVILKSDQEEQLWEIDYDRGLSLNVSEYMSLKNINSQNSSITRYYGRIEDFLKEERSCINIHYHESVAASLLPTRIHIGKRGSGGIVEGCKFSNTE